MKSFKDLSYYIILDILMFKVFEFNKKTKKYDLIGYFKNDKQRKLFQIFRGIRINNPASTEIYYFKDHLKWVYLCNYNLNIQWTTMNIQFDFEKKYRNLERISFSQNVFKDIPTLKFTEEHFPKLRILDIANSSILELDELPKLKILFWYDISQYNLNVSKLPNNLETLYISFTGDVKLNQQFFKKIHRIKKLNLTSYYKKIIIENKLKLNDLIKIKFYAANNVSNLITNSPNIKKLKLRSCEFNYFDHYQNLINLKIDCIKFSKSSIFSRYNNKNLKKLEIWCIHKKEFYENWNEFPNLECLDIGVLGNQHNETYTIDIFKTYLFKNLKFLALHCKINIMGHKKNFEKLKGIFFGHYVLNVNKFFGNFKLNNLSILYFQKLKDLNIKDWKFDLPSANCEDLYKRFLLNGEV